MADLEGIPITVPRALAWDDRLDVKDQTTIADINTAVNTLFGLLAVEINVSGHFARSKIAWKLASYQHALLHRMLRLMDGVALSFNQNSNVLVALLAARAFMETFAAFAELESRLPVLLAAEDLAGLDHIGQNGLFANRDSEMLATHPDTKAINAQTFVDKYDKRTSGFREHYGLLSEFCHPNAAGHARLFSLLDTSDGTVCFGEEAQPAGLAHLVIGAIFIVLDVERLMTRLDKVIVDISDYHHRVAPAPAR
jgi:hypothetical protein